jgi:endonuclease YncB( thermonuclease family)
MRPLVVCALVAGVVLSGCGESGGQEGPSDRVTRVIDGDTVEMERLGKVRLIGVNTPEEERCFETAATRFTRTRLEGRVVQYELGVDRTDRYDRTLAYLSRDGQMHNEALLSEGYAKVLTVEPNDKYEQRFEEAERQARTTDTGLWFTCDRNRIREERATRARQRQAAADRRAARRRARRERAQERAEAERRAEEESSSPEYSAPDTRGGGGSPDDAGGSCLPASACPGRRDGDGDGCYCE